ncbi:hypothetical protein SAMN06269301_2821 [Geobacter sp. DSM 9736]|nr:hypothetical protein SAMN06269301_2821 [Geobacter sp. DSM 9736]
MTPRAVLLLMAVSAAKFAPSLHGAPMCFQPWTVWTCPMMDTGSKRNNGFGTQRGTRCRFLASYQVTPLGWAKWPYDLGKNQIPLRSPREGQRLPITPYYHFQPRIGQPSARFVQIGIYHIRHHRHLPRHLRLYRCRSITVAPGTHNLRYELTAQERNQQNQDYRTQCLVKEMF